MLARHDSGALRNSAGRGLSHIIAHTDTHVEHTSWMPLYSFSLSSISRSDVTNLDHST